MKPIPTILFSSIWLFSNLAYAAPSVENLITAAQKFFNDISLCGGYTSIGFDAKCVRVQTYKADHSKRFNGCQYIQITSFYEKGFVKGGTPPFEEVMVHFNFADFDLQRSGWDPIMNYFIFPDLEAHRFWKVDHRKFETEESVFGSDMKKSKMSAAEISFTFRRKHWKEAANPAISILIDECRRESR